MQLKFSQIFFETVRIFTFLPQAASVNPIDTVMRKGYGRQLCSAVKNLRNWSMDSTILLPFIGGRDCSGVVEQIGGNVKRFKKGDEVGQRCFYSRVV